MTAPIRIRRKRTKGWKMPPNTVSVTRPGKWGNPFVVGKTYETVAAGAAIVDDAAHAVRLFRAVALTRKAEIIGELRGKNLACFCALGRSCHADVLLELANADSAIERNRRRIHAIAHPEAQA
jgi:hypothetical protein